VADFVQFLGLAFVLGVPVVLAAMGGLTSERSGVMNIGLEGKMLFGACVTAMVATSTQNAWLGLVGGIGAAILASLLHGVLTQVYRMDHVISGMSINILAWGGTSYLYSPHFTDRAFGSTIPVVPREVFYLLAVAIPAVIWVYLKRTRGGIRLMAVGNDPEKSRQMGIDPIRVRFMALVATGVFCGLAGAMIVSNTGRFSEGMTSGRGFIALAALIIGGWRPVPTMIACFAFMLFQALQIQFQGQAIFGVMLPNELWLSMPYLVTLLALAGLISKNSVPAGLGKA